ncbi:GDSL-type esterase/lipase family protein [Allocoleopsis sp.]|uniref:GDSL-type esterase/lipase family protein n=1 Tax=Allocoleopsis sp. TaxID=3088169 RepID=UPI002FD0FA98
MVKFVLLISILLNILILGLGSIWVYSKGGMPYIIRKTSFLQSAASRAKFMYDSPYYWERKSHFETLPKSESDIVFLGDSLTNCCEWHEFFINVRLKNRGISGDTTNGVLNRINEVIETKPRKIFIMIGINDLNQGVKVEDVFNNYRIILKVFQEKVPQSEVFIQSLLPLNNQKFSNNGVNYKIIELNVKLKELAQEFSCHYIDLYSSFLDSNNQLDERYTIDGIHLNGQGYLVWKGIIEQDVMN